MSRREVRLSGFGGQGIVLAGLILGKAAALHEGRHACMTQSYGPESRGGACTADVIVSDEEIDYPLVTAPDVLVALSREACFKHLPSVRAGGLAIFDADLAEPGAQTCVRLLPLPATRLAEQLGKKLVANMVALGFLAAATDCLGPQDHLARQAMVQAIRSSVPRQFVSLNLQAFDVGYAYAVRRVTTGSH